MDLIVYPHGLFRLDFGELLTDARDQEAKHPANSGEYKIADGIHLFFKWHVFRLIRTNSWVYEASQEFAQDYAMECFRYLKVGGNETYQSQKKLHDINEKIVNLLARLGNSGLAPSAGTIDLVKGSDFVSLVNKNQLDQGTLREVEELHEDAVEQEDMQIWITLRAIRDNYEITLPRVMFVIRRVIKVMLEDKPKDSDNTLTGISNYLDWYETKVGTSHLLYPVLGNLRSFYTVARNVGSHHDGFSWDPINNKVLLKDKTTELSLHVHEFQQKYRYLIYLCEFGLRGILSAFCEREQGEISNKLIREYGKTFPEDFPEGIPGRVRFYVNPIQDKE